ncbi:MAG: aldehyde dehydrogenase family protein [Verrucomicrobiae bacterium]|nr:aldehyde dehydrogenase family protein [Verrucomicrobiae bacterium]
MSTIPHLPALRWGRAYESLDQVEVKDIRTGEVLARVSHVNAGIVRRDLQRATEAAAALRKLPAARLLEVCAAAAERFLNDTLPLGVGGATQSPAQYIQTLSRTSGLPHVLIRRNMERIHTALSQMSAVLRGLSRGLELSVLDSGWGEQNGARVSFAPTAHALGVVMPSNSPAVNALWLPAIALKTPVALKPGREEPWTPWRLIQAFIAAGVPPEAFGFYPTDHEGAAAILAGCGRALLFGDQSTTAQYAHNPAIQIHGPGWSKILIGNDCIEHWREFLDVMVSSVVENGGRSCLNASAIVVPRYAPEIADALAQRLAAIEPTRPDDPNARLAAFANPKMADAIDAQIEAGLQTPGAVDATAHYRRGPRKVLFEGAVFLKPTIVHCASFEHPLANREFLFPYASVVEVPQAEMLRRIGPTLVCTAITRDAAFIEQLMACPHIDRLNIGPVPTMKISWDQPHEGNLFELLWRRRSFERGW